MKKIKSLIIIALCFCWGCIDYQEDYTLGDLRIPDPQTSWTIMFYADPDDMLCSYIQKDVSDMAYNIENNGGINLIVLFDGPQNPSNGSGVLGKYFSDTRLYRIVRGGAVKLYDESGEFFPNLKPDSPPWYGNMGNPNTLRSFIRYCKANFPADNYGLLFSSHGSGPRKKSAPIEFDEFSELEQFNEPNQFNQFRGRAIGSGGDGMLYIGEISYELDYEDSVDFIGFDACIMGSVEIAYQYRPGNGSFQADYMIASSGNVWANGWNYVDIFKRLRTGNRGSKYVDPKNMIGADFGKLVVDTYKDYVNSFNSGRPNNWRVREQTMSCYDLSKVEDLKNSFDALAVQLKDAKAETCDLRGFNTSTNVMHYFDTANTNEWRAYPFFDMYDFCNKIANRSNFSFTARERAQEVCDKISQVVISSWGDIDFEGFTPRQNGMFFFFPDGDRTSGGGRHWASQRNWYNPNRMPSSSGYGNLYWCRDGMDTTPDSVGNWYQLLDYWFR